MRFSKSALAILFSLFAAPAYAASCFWVGGTGSSNDPTHWSSSSGGAGSTCGGTGGLPVSSADSATWDANSGGGTTTINMTSPWTIGTLSAAQFAGTWDNSVNNVNITATATGSPFGWSGTGVRTLRFGSATYTLTNSNSTWNLGTTTNATVPASTASIVFPAGTALGTRTFAGGGFSYGSVAFGASATSGGIVTITGANTLGILTIGAYNTVQFVNGATNTIGTANFTGTSSAQLLVTSQSSAGSQATLAITTLNGTYTGWRDIIMSGAALIAQNSFDFGNNSGFTIVPPASGGGGGRIIGG